MNLKQKFRVLATITTVLIAAASSGVFADSEVEVRRVLSGLEESWNAGDMEGYLDAYARGDAMSLAFGNQHVSNWDELNALFRKSYPDPERMGRFTIDTFNVSFLSGDVAVAYGRFTHYFSHEIVHGGYSHVLQKDADDVWTIRHERTSRGRTEIVE